MASAPALREYRPLELTPVPLAALLAWVPERKEATLFDDRCQPMRVGRGERALQASVAGTVRTRGHIKRVEGSEVEYGVEVSLLGSGWTDYARGADGGWAAAGQRGVGDLAVVPGVLTSVEKDVARWTGAIVRLRAVCEAYREEASPCGDGERVCRTCQSIGVEVEPLTKGVAASRSVAFSVRQRLKPGRCGQPCPADPNLDTLDRLNRLLAGRKFVQPTAVPDRPTLYRTRSACPNRRESR